MERGGFLHVGPHFFEHRLCLLVGIRAFDLWTNLGDRNDCCGAIYGSRRRGDDILAVVVAYGVLQLEDGFHVVS